MVDVTRYKKGMLVSAPIRARMNVSKSGGKEGDGQQTGESIMGLKVHCRVSGGSFVYARMDTSIKCQKVGDGMEYLHKDH